MSERGGAQPKGGVCVALRVEGQWAISLLTEGWSDGEKAALLAGETDARAALRDEAVLRTMRDPDEVDVEHVEVTLHSRGRIGDE